MIESIHFTNFKALRDTTLKLGRFTLLVGPNGCGKSTVLQALQAVSTQSRLDFPSTMSVGSTANSAESISVSAKWDSSFEGSAVTTTWSAKQGLQYRFTDKHGNANSSLQPRMKTDIRRWRFFALDEAVIPHEVMLQPEVELQSNGALLAGVLDQMRDRNPERFEQINQELARWLPEFDRILFTTPAPSQRRFELRTRRGGYPIPARQLSQGTLLALAMLTIGHLPTPPPLVGFEEPDRGLHPRLLRDVRDAMYRLAYPEEFNDSREPVQVVATTHSPYLLDLFSDHPEEVVIANKIDSNVKFERLSDRADLHEILQDSHLGDAWYTGILGGVPANT